MKMVPAGTFSTKTDGSILDGAYSSEAETILPVGTSSTKIDEDCSSWYFQYQKR